MEKYQVFLYLKTQSGWQRMMKSTVLTLSMNPVTETYDYISDESPTEELRRYKKSIDQDLSTVVGNPDFELVWDYYFNMKTGENAKTEVMIVYAGKPGTPASSFVAEKAEATVVVNNYDAVASKLNFSIMFGGTVQQGTATIADGTPTFVPAV